MALVAEPEQLLQALDLIAARVDALAARCLRAKTANLDPEALQLRANGIVVEALTAHRSAFTEDERLQLSACVERAESEALDAMLRVRMTRRQLTEDLPALAESAGYSGASEYVRARLFRPDEAEERIRAQAIEEAVRVVESLQGRPRLSAVVDALKDLLR